MYKIRQLLLWLFIASPTLLVGQTGIGNILPSLGQITISQFNGLQSGSVAGYSNRQTVFTAHLLADQVEPGKKNAYNVLIEGQKASLPYPTPFQNQSLQPWRTGLPPFHFAVGS